MKMAKATPDDFKMMQDFFDCLETHTHPDEEVSDKVLARYVRTAMRGRLASARNRVILGAEILIDTVCDPDKSYLDWKPELKQLVPETKNEKGETLFYVISYTHSAKGVLMFWGADNKGYTLNIKLAGTYTESKIRSRMDYYHQGESAVAISVEELHGGKFKIVENVWLNHKQKQIHLQRVKDGLLVEPQKQQPA